MTKKRNKKLVTEDELQGTYFYSRVVNFCDVDAMEVVHHSNYLKYFEESRFAWLNHVGLEEHHWPKSDKILAVIDYQCKHYRPARFNDNLRVYTQVKNNNAKIIFQYLVFSSSLERSGELLAWGETTHVWVNQQIQPERCPAPIRQLLENQQWIETWR